MNGEQPKTQKQYANEIVNAREAGDVVILVGDCMINYDGRAWSYTEGVHSIIINPSGSVVIHDEDSVKPKNWQSSGAKTKVRLGVDGEVVINSKKSSPDERLSVRFNQIEDLITYSPTDEKFVFEGSEKDMHKYIVNNPSIIEEGFQPVEMEKEVETGDIDIYGYDKDSNEMIIEVKRKKAQQENIGQLRRYLDTFASDNVRGILVAPNITEPAKSVLENKYEYEFVQLRPGRVIDDTDNQK